MATKRIDTETKHRKHAHRVLAGDFRDTKGMNDGGGQAWKRWEVFKNGERIAVLPDEQPRLLDRYIEDDDCEIFESLFLGTDLTPGEPPGEPISRKPF